MLSLENVSRSNGVAPQMRRKNEGGLFSIFVSLKREMGDRRSPLSPTHAGKIDVIVIQIFRISQSKRFTLNHRLPSDYFAAAAGRWIQVFHFIFGGDRGSTEVVLALSILPSQVPF